MQYGITDVAYGLSYTTFSQKMTSIQDNYIPLRELSYQRWMDAAGYSQSGQDTGNMMFEIARLW